MPIVNDLSGNGTHSGDKSNVSRTKVSKSYTVTPSDSVDLTNGVTQAIMVGVAGDVKVTYGSGVIDTIPLGAGVWHPMNVKRIWSTDTTATGIRAAY